jgi:hypothetical protein
LFHVRIDVIGKQPPAYGDVEIQLPNAAIERFLAGKLFAAFRMLSK